jgi:mycothiol synthase
VDFPPDLGKPQDVRILADAVAEADGVEPFSEATWLGLVDDAAVTHLGRHAGDALVGYAQVRDDGSTELAVHPGHRRRGHGRALLEVAMTVAPQLRVWSYSGHPAAGVLAEHVGLVVVRELRLMSRSLPLEPEVDPPGPVPLPPDVTVRQFTPGLDETAWLTVNSRAFAGHGEQGRWTMADLLSREAADWFDPAGFFLAQRAGELVGFHWTKVHPGAGAAGAAGEIYVLAVDPGFGGGGLGGALARIGLRHLAACGLPTVSLYVDGHNGAAIRVYERLGFRTDSVSVMYGVPHPS